MLETLRYRKLILDRDIGYKVDLTFELAVGILTFKFLSKVYVGNPKV